MIVTLQTERVRTLEQVRAFLGGNEAVDFAGVDRDGVYDLVRRTLVRLRYHRLGKGDKGLVKRYLGKVTGLSRAQLDGPREGVPLYNLSAEWFPTPALGVRLSFVKLEQDEFVDTNGIGLTAGWCFRRNLSAKVSFARAPGRCGPSVCVSRNRRERDP